MLRDSMCHVETGTWSMLHAGCSPGCVACDIAGVSSKLLQLAWWMVARMVRLACAMLRATCVEGSRRALCNQLVDHWQVSWGGGMVHGMVLLACPPNPTAPGATDTAESCAARTRMTTEAALASRPAADGRAGWQRA